MISTDRALLLVLGGPQLQLELSSLKALTILESLFRDANGPIVVVTSPSTSLTVGQPSLS